MYWGIGSKRRISQNVLLLAASYTFYGLWDWRFLFLLLASSLVDYIAARAIHHSKNRSVKKRWLWLSLVWNIGILITFKYFNFFIDSFEGLFGIDSGSGYTFWNVAIPLGLSFYTFQTMSYTIDVFQKKTKPTNSLLNFMCFVSFFPQLIAGPIERARFLIPQFEKKRRFNLQQSKEGLRQVLWGLFKKILVADKIGIAVTMVFDNPEGYGFITLCYVAILFSFQVYCDFSGYTDIAIGTAKLFGFKLHKNFRIPYLAKSITQFWQRWHITLTKWFTDYVYVPIVKSARKMTVTTRVFGLLLTMTLVGLWHGANWTFVFFGIFNGLVLATERIPFFGKRKTLAKLMPAQHRIITVIYFFAITSISSIFFRAESIADAALILKRIFTFAKDEHLSTLIGIKLGYLLLMIAAEIATRHWDFPLQKLELKVPKPLRWVLYYIIVFLIIRYAEPKEAFIYFQF